MARYSPPMFDLDRLHRDLAAAACRCVVDYLPVCGSTNSVLAERALAGAPTGSVVIAGEQTAGRGRRGRPWWSAADAGLMFSLLWRFAPGIVPLGASLAAGVAVMRALSDLGVDGLALKWPNDVLKSGKKLAGILVELVAGQTQAAVIGIGLNLRVPATLPVALRDQVAALDTPRTPQEVLVALLVALERVLVEFEQGGFAALRDEWLRHHAYQDAEVCLLSDFSPPRQGRCRGVDDAGALLLECAGRLERFWSGELSLRPLS